jgi:hypothetical protein
MTLRASTKLRNAMLGGATVRHVATVTGTDIAAVDGGASADTFTQVAAGFVTAGFSVGDSILSIGFTGANAGSIGPFTLTDVAAGTLTVATGSIIASDAATESVTIVALTGCSLKDIFKDGVLKIYSGSQPATADAAITGSLLATITVGSGAWAAGAVAYGLEFGAAAAGVISKNSDVWSGTVAATGTAGYFRLYANAADAGALDSGYIYPRIDGAIATSGAQLNLSSVSLVAAAPLTIDTFSLTFPM